jgi:hypothetical protein
LIALMRPLNAAVTSRRLKHPKLQSGKAKQACPVHMTRTQQCRYNDAHKRERLCTLFHRLVVECEEGRKTPQWLQSHAVTHEYSQGFPRACRALDNGCRGPACARSNRQMTGPRNGREEGSHPGATRSARNGGTQAVPQEAAALHEEGEPVGAWQIGRQHGPANRGYVGR